MTKSSRFLIFQITHETVFTHDHCAMHKTFIQNEAATIGKLFQSLPNVP